MDTTHKLAHESSTRLQKQLPHTAQEEDVFSAPTVTPGKMWSEDGNEEEDFPGTHGYRMSPVDFGLTAALPM